MAKRKTDHLPLVYSCSGCSSAAQMANDLAVRLDREGFAEMSCIAGVGGGVGSLVRKAVAGRPIIAVDGCHLRCVRQCLARHDVQADAELLLSEHGVKKRYHADYDVGEAEAVYAELTGLARDMTKAPGANARTEEKVE
jgi:uncharacterized metal-binding protein